MIIGITGSVGSGKTTLGKELSKKLNSKTIHLNEESKKYYLEKDERLDTYVVDTDKLIPHVERSLKTYQEREQACIVEGHFTQWLSPEYFDKIIILNRPLEELKKEYLNRNYNEQKILDNLEAESFDICFLEAEERGFTKDQIIQIENGVAVNLTELLESVFKAIQRN